MKINSIVAFNTHGTVEISIGDQIVKLQLDDAPELEEIKAAAFKLFARHQAKLAEDIAKAHPPLLAAPDCIDGEYEEVQY